MTRWEVDIGTTKFGVEFENNVGTVLTFWVSNVFHLTVSRDRIRGILDCTEKRSQGQCR